MTDGHRSAIAASRRESETVRAYLEWLVTPWAPGRRRSPEQTKARLAALERELSEAPAIRRLQLLQERIDLRAALEAPPVDDGVALEDGFVEVAAAYSERRGISYGAWREVGVPAAVLRRAGVAR